MSIQSVVSGFFKKILSFLKSDQAKSAVLTAAQLAEVALPYVVEFGSAGLIPAKVISVLEKYGLPIANSLANGTAPVDEIKLLIGQAVATILKHNHNISTTVANIARDMAYLDAQALKLVPATA